MQGNLRKMRVDLQNPVEYTMLMCDSQGNEVHAETLNKHIGKKIRLTYTNAINCIACGRATKKSYSQGYCYPCMSTLAECDMCIMKPETCHYFKGTCRDEAWADTHCMQHHYVYLANSSGIKVGITRGTQIPTRWIDQGAIQAMPIFKVKNRLQSGLLEVAIKNHVSDRTDWRKMLKGLAEEIDLTSRRDELLELCNDDIANIIADHDEGDIEKLADADVVDITYPVMSYPTKVSSLNFDKTPEISGELVGIKGQYLILDTGVLNIRKFSGYHVGLEIM